jgi:hypothetical protein
MNFSIATLFLLASAASASILDNARRLDQAAADNEYAFLGDYNLKLLTCNSKEVFVNPADGSSEYGSVIFRLCPTKGECSDAAGKGCKDGYGDFIVGMNSFVEEYLQQKRDEMQADDNFKVEQLGECRQYEADKDGDYADGVYYVGPTCSADGTGIRVALFSDEGCMTLEESITFEEISAGISLPYAEGGLVSDYCEACYSVNDNGEAGLNELCMNLYELSGKCESKMETYHYTGIQEGACETISALLPKSKKSGSAGKVIGWLFFAMVVVGLVGFAFTAMKKKGTKDGDKNFGLMS